MRFDYYCWDLYARVSAHFKDHPEALAWRQETLHAIEHGGGDLAHLAAIVADAIVDYHLKTMDRLGIEYDVLPRESEILHLRFWEAAFAQLKDRQAIYLETEGKNKGCWVMPASAFKQQADEDADDSKVIVRSNNTVTYVGKDIAYQLWKFGLLGKGFFLPAFGTVRWPHCICLNRPTAARRGALHSAMASWCTTSSTRASHIYRTSWWPACARWVITSRRITRCIFRTRWSR